MNYPYAGLEFPPNLTNQPNKKPTMKYIHKIQQDTTANYYGIHGIIHWKNVEKFAIYIAKHENVNLNVLRDFAYFHDFKRENDDYDSQHGPRAAHHWLDQTPHKIQQLATASRHHTPDKPFNHLTILASYNCDRLDLPRASIKIDTNFLYTETAKRIVRKGNIV